MADTSVKFISDSIDAKTYLYLGRKADLQVLSEF